MELNEYQEKTEVTAIYPNAGNNVYYPTLGLVGEAGEIANKVKKIMRDGDGVITDDVRKTLSKEIGDVMWYIGRLCSELDIYLDDVCSANLDKLLDRKNRNALKGSGDNR